MSPFQKVDLSLNPQKPVDRQEGYTLYYSEFQCFPPGGKG